MAPAKKGTTKARQQAPVQQDAAPGAAAAAQQAAPAAAAQQPAPQAKPQQAPLQVVEALIAEMETRRTRALEQEIVPRPKLRSWASSISTCDRQSVYSILNWQDRKMHDAHLQARFGAGNEQERIILRQLAELGFDVVEAQANLEPGMMERYAVSGRIDGKVPFMGRRVPLEIKSMHPRVYAKLEPLNNDEAVQYLMGDPFLVNYYRQLQLYLLGHSEEAGLFLFTDCLGHWKPVAVQLNYDEAEKVLQRLERIKEHVDAKTLPDRVSWDEGVCGRCAFLHLCQPDVARTEGAAFLDDAELQAKLDQRAQLADAAAEYAKLDATIKAHFKGAQQGSVVVGDWLITGKSINVASYDVPKDVKAQYKVQRPQWRTSIKRLSDAATDDA